MAWDKDLLDDQKKAAAFTGRHVRLLAGPGTGKTLTLTRRAAYLVSKKAVQPSEILALTFTRSAAFELRKRIADILELAEQESPRVSTLHSFALRQLLRNSDCIDTVPQPLRIADDWEERWIILEDLRLLSKTRVTIVKEKLNRLSADWQTLDADKRDWEKRFPDPRFLGAWRQHREIFGYTLRSELVYQLKRALERAGEFELESDYRYLLVDEYQDLNRCDLAVIKAIRSKEVEIFGAGDDDQSIYGFRFAHPEGIRRFPKDHTPSRSLSLKTCVRCDRKIIALSLFVANLDPDRLPKPLECCNHAGEGEVQILRFKNQHSEARGVASLCSYLLREKSYLPKDILILMRSDRNQVFSSPLRAELEAASIPVSVRVEGGPLDTFDGRMFLSFLRLLPSEDDSLALRTLLMLRDNQVGKESLSAIYDLARKNGATFAQATQAVMANPALVPRLGARVCKEMQKIQRILNKHQDRFQDIDDSSDSGGLLKSLKRLAKDVIADVDRRKQVLAFLKTIITETSPVDHIELLRSLSSSLEDQEQELDSDKVNIMTMHKAKGLTANAVIVVAAEDEYLPGRQIGEKQGDERRLLYVSLSRARHFLFVTYCQRRVGGQAYTGRTSGEPRRSLTRFLVDAPIEPVRGATFLATLMP